MDEQRDVFLESSYDTDQVQIADDVIAVIAEIATLEIEGIVSTFQPKNDFVHAISRKKTSKGVKVIVGEEDVLIDIKVIVKYGIKIPKVCLQAQEKVKNSVETMTGLKVSSVNVHVVGVVCEKDRQD